MINLHQDQKKGRKKTNTYESVIALYESGELTLNSFKCEIFPIKATK